MTFEFLDHFSGQNIFILGDLMLDEYLWGDAKRISPEAPVQVIEIQRESLAPGGACNVAVNIASLGGKPFLGGVVGKDSAAQRLRAELSKLGIDLAGLVEDGNRPTITKTRLVARNQQIVRYDRELHVPLDESLQRRLLDWVTVSIPQVSLCVFSDYAKGLSTPAFLEKFLQLASDASKPVIIDPKGSDFQKYQGATLITPNLQEVEYATGLEIHSEADLLAAYKVLHERLPSANILVKQGSEGMTLFSNFGEKTHVEAEARQVFDVTGAGDTVVAVLAMAMAAGASLQDATQMANRAAGIVVAKVGTASLTIAELNQGNR